MSEFLEELKKRTKSPDMLAALERIKQPIEDMAATELAKLSEVAPAQESKEVSDCVQLPLWPEPVRATPNSFLRSALFAAIQGKDRKHMKKQVLATMKGVEIRFTGIQLDQSDLDVWEQAVHLARREALGNVCYFRANSFLKAVGRSNGKADYVWLNDSITRLVACAVEIRSNTKVFTGSLLSSCLRDEATGAYKLTLDPAMIALYGPNDWTSIQMQERMALKRKPLALWLHGFYSTHAIPYPLKVNTLRELSGSGNKNNRDFKRKLKLAFEDLVPFGIRATFDGDLVFVEKEATRSQNRHRIRKLVGGKN